LRAPRAIASLIAISILAKAEVPPRFAFCGAVPSHAARSTERR
jgi:hypothetical protein